MTLGELSASIAHEFNQPIGDKRRQRGYGALIAESYPTPGRATAQNVLFNIGRGVGGFGPLVVGILAAQYSLATADHST